MYVLAQVGCFGPDAQPLITELLGDFCANIVNEADSIAHAGYPEQQKDLFMEQRKCACISYMYLHV